jgi:hypothetical protein
MQFLIEEFFKKVFKHINGINVLIIRFAVKSISLMILLLLAVYLILQTIKQNYLPIVLITGLILLAEISHYLRKSREKVMTNKATEKNSVTKKPKNTPLLKTSNAKNKILLKASKTKNNTLLKKSRKIKSKTISKKSKKKSTSHKIDKALIKSEKSKNKTLLKTNKAKNKDMLKGV